MKIKPTGYYVLIKMEEVKETIEEGALKGFQLSTGEDHKRQQDGHDVGRIEGFGPNCYRGFRGIDDNASLEERALQYGCKVGDQVEFNRYDGKQPRHLEEGNYRIIQDEHIIGVYSNE